MQFDIQVDRHIMRVITYPLKGRRNGRKSMLGLEASMEASPSSSLGRTLIQKISEEMAGKACQAWRLQLRLHHHRLVVCWLLFHLSNFFLFEDDHGRNKRYKISKQT